MSRLRRVLRRPRTSTWAVIRSAIIAAEADVTFWGHPGREIRHHGDRCQPPPWGGGRAASDNTLYWKAYFRRYERQYVALLATMSVEEIARRSKNSRRTTELMHAHDRDIVRRLHAAEDAVERLQGLLAASTSTKP